MARAALLLAGGAGLAEGREAAQFSEAEYLVRSWNSEDGLPAASIRAVARTPDGYLWVGTDQGLARFDGARFVVLSTNGTPMFGDNRIAALRVDRDGELWLATQGGTLARRRGADFESVWTGRDLGGGVNALAQDGDGAWWLATAGRGVVRWRPGGGEVFRQTNGVPSDHVTTVESDRQGGIWAVAGGRVVRFTDGRWVVPEAARKLPAPVVAMVPAREGGMWAATSASATTQSRGGRVFHLADAAVARELDPYPWPQDTFHTEVRALFEDGTGRLWVGMMGAGLFCRESNSGWRPPAATPTFSHVLIRCLAEDDAGGLWVGLEGAQLDQLRRRPVTTHHLPADSSLRVIRMASATHDGSVWVGTDGDGVFRFRNGSFTQYAGAEGLTNGFIGVILEDRRTNLWVGTWGGLFRLRGERFEAVRDPAPVRGIVRSMLEDREGNLWVGTALGVVVMPRQGQAGLVAGPDTYVGAQVMAIEQDAAGTIWVASSRRGLFRLAAGRFERYQGDPWAGRAEISCLRADGKGGLWIGTLGAGLGYVKAGESRRWSTKEGLPSGGLRAILDDTEGNLWFGSDNGIFGCPPGRLLAHRSGVDAPILPWHLSPAEGLDTRRCSGIGQPVAARSADGRLWMPNWRALAVFDPALARRQVPLRPVVLEEVLVDGVPQPVDGNGVLRVQSGARSYEIHYTSPNLETPERVRFRYRLNGADAGWVEAQQRRAAYYSRLPPGRYDFHVMAGDPSGDWQEAAPALQILVVPLWWERSVTQVAIGLGLMAAVGATVLGLERARSRRRLQRAEAQQAMERERQRIARDLHDDLGGDLTEIMLLGELAARPDTTPEARRSYAETIAGRSRQVAAAMDEIVWTVNPRNDSVPRLADRVAEVARRLFEPLPVRLPVEIMEDIPDAPLPAPARHALYLAAKEALNNAAKHAGATEVKLGVWCDAGRLVLAVEDDGRGFDPASLARGRNGLDNMRQRMEGIGGVFSIVSSPGQGTRVRLEYPLPAAAPPRSSP